MTSKFSDSRVSDAPANVWVYRLLPAAIWPYAQLARWDRPIGWWLLLWPCWWSLALAANHVPLHEDGAFHDTYDIAARPFYLLALFFLFWLGAVAMRGAGCSYNDLVDADLDGRVVRTASRPIPSGRVNRTRAIGFLGSQGFVGLICLIWLCLLDPEGFNWFAFNLGMASLVIVVVYPFAKRVTDWPQFVLGLAFSWGALMGWALMWSEISLPSLALYGACIAWVIGYDTIYAHQDKEDDALIGVRSTARLFGDRTRPVLTLVYFITLVLFALALAAASSGWPAWLGLAAGSGHMLWQIRELDIDDSDNCLRLFKSNNRFGLVVFAGLMADLIL